jgi:hypothetical protein
MFESMTWVWFYNSEQMSTRINFGSRFCVTACKLMSARRPLLTQTLKVHLETCLYPFPLGVIEASGITDRRTGRILPNSLQPSILGRHHKTRGWVCP